MDMRELLQEKKSKNKKLKCPSENVFKDYFQPKVEGSFFPLSQEIVLTL